MRTTYLVLALVCLAAAGTQNARGILDGLPIVNNLVGNNAGGGLLGGLPLVGGLLGQDGLVGGVLGSHGLVSNLIGGMTS